MNMEKRDEMVQIPIRRYVVLIAVFFMLLAYFLMPMLSWPEMPMGTVLTNVIGSRHVSLLVPLSLVVLFLTPFLELFLFIPKEASKEGRMMLVLVQIAALFLLYSQVSDISVFGFSLVKLGPGFIFYSISAAGLFITELVVPEYSPQNNSAQKKRPLQHENSPLTETSVKAEEAKEEGETFPPIPSEEIINEVMEKHQPTVTQGAVRLINEEFHEEMKQDSAQYQDAISELQSSSKRYAANEQKS